MDKNRYLEDFNVEDSYFKKEILKYLSFWPWFLISIIAFFGSSLLYLRYAEYSYKTSATLEIIDEAQNSEMALPTSLTVFNRSLINLENEINILSSYSLHSEVVKELNSNIKFYISGRIKTAEYSPSEWFDSYLLEFKDDTNIIKSLTSFEIEIENNRSLIISEFKNSELVKEYNFKGLTTTKSSDELPFELTINEISSFEKRILRIFPFVNTVNSFRKSFQVVKFGLDSDQLKISLEHPNKKIAQNYLNKLLIAFDQDGIGDRQFEYKNTITFVDKRSEILKSELKVIESRKQDFKQNNNFTNLESDAEYSIREQLAYDSELFESESQRNLAEYLLESMSEKKYDYLPMNVGIENFDLNVMISEYNQLLRERDRYLNEAGSNNPFVISLENELNKFSLNIENSIVNYLNSLEIKISELENKENEFINTYKELPENEKILRTIDRELSVKEALFLLLLQKREEAAINYAVVKPTIKIIDYAISDDEPISPSKKIMYLTSIILGLFTPFTILFFRFYLDNKIHSKDQLITKLGNDIPVLAEIPYITSDDEKNIISNSSSRNILSESIRILNANLNFTLVDNNVKSKIILVTSSIKGEGKTLVSVNMASILSSSKKVILLGADLRNPQIHKLLNKEKNSFGLSDLLYKSEIADYKKYLIQNENLDIILSGTIPPNPTELLASINFKNLLDTLKKDYDFIIIDSAPCLLVSDTFEISELVDSVVYIFRSNFTDNKLCDFIIESKDLNKFNNLSVVLNAVGNSNYYGYKYGYQYGYQYGYKYGYNYGYGYGYSDSKK